MVQFDSPSALQAWLNSQNIDTAQWGTSNAKTIQHLWREIQREETSIRGCPPVRYVRVVEVRVLRHNAILIETAQHFQDGRVRRRQRPPSEKLLADESYQTGAIRCLIEEVGVRAEEIRLHLETHAIRQFEIESPSYPNLKTQYEYHSVNATVSGLPSVDFCALNVHGGPADPVIAHEWSWQDESLVDST